MKVLTLCHAFPFPPRDGHVGPIFHFLKHLAPRLELTMLTIRPEDEGEWREGLALFQSWGMRVEAAPWRARRKPLQALACLTEGRPWPNRFYSPEFRRLVARELDGGGWDAILAWGIMSAQHLPRRPGAPMLLMARDCLSLGHRRRQQANGGLGEWLQWRKIRAMERAIFGASERVFAVSPIDAEEMRRIAPGTRVEVLPTGVDAEAFRPAPEREQDGVVLFSGVMDYPPNEDAALWLAHEIWPLVRAARPGARLVLAGRSPTAAVAELAGADVIVTGPVERMEDEVARAAVVVSPLRQGTGIKNKVMEAAFMAKAMVVTGLSLDGLPLEAGRDCLVADEAGAFAAAVVLLLGDAAERRRLGEAARASIAEQFDVERLVPRLVAILEETRR